MKLHFALVEIYDHLIVQNVAVLNMHSKSKKQMVEAEVDGPEEETIRTLYSDMLVKEGNRGPATSVFNKANPDASEGKAQMTTRI
jgi:hypothetical protein